MTKKELVELLRPLIKETVKEVILEESGIVTKLVKECLEGYKTSLLESKMANEEYVLVRRIKEDVAESRKNILKDIKLDSQERSSMNEERQKLLQEQRKRLLDSIGMNLKDGTNPFTGTSPLKENKPLTESVGGEAVTVPSPLSGIDPSDPGIDIGNILGNRKWNFSKDKKR